MLNEIRKIPVFIARDFRILFTYKIAFSMSFLNVIFNLFYFVLFGSMFGSSNILALAEYGGDFISYIIVGSIGWGFLWSIMGATAESLRREMMIGTLESVLLTSTKTITMTVSYALFGSFFGLLSIFILVVVGFGLFGLNVFATASIYTVIIFILSAIMMMGFGMIFGGFTIWLKNIRGTVSLIQNIAMFFCGVYFPLSVLPTSLQPVAQYMPFWYSIEGLRRSLIPSTPQSEILYFIGVLVVVTIIFTVLGLFMLHKGLTKAKKEGSLMFY